MERKWQLIIFFIAMIILSAGGYGYIISESTAPPEMETYDFGEFTMEIPEDSNVKLAGSDLSLSVYVGDNFQVIKINKTFYENQNELNHILEQTSIENLTNSSRIVETSNNITYYQITDENNIIGFENETYIAINNNNPSSIIIISSYDLDFVYRVGETVSVDDFDDNRWNECAPGIHFFITRQISIRTPRGGSDEYNELVALMAEYFNPHSPWGE